MQKEKKWNPDPERTKMPFGKHKGEMLGDIPKNYLEWVLENFVWTKYSDLKSDIERTVKML